MCFNFLKRLFAGKAPDTATRKPAEPEPVMIHAVTPKSGGGAYLVLPKAFFESLGDRKLVHAKYKVGAELRLVFLEKAEGVKVTDVKPNRRIYNNLLAKALIRETGSEDVPFRQISANALITDFTQILKSS